MYDFVEIPAAALDSCLACGGSKWLDPYRAALRHAKGVRITNSSLIRETRKNSIRSFFQCGFQLETIFV